MKRFPSSLLVSDKLETHMNWCFNTGGSAGWETETLKGKLRPSESSNFQHVLNFQKDILHPISSNLRKLSKVVNKGAEACL